jgi:hypothetical protein
VPHTGLRKDDRQERNPHKAKQKTHVKHCFTPGIGFLIGLLAPRFDKLNLSMVVVFFHDFSLLELFLLQNVLLCENGWVGGKDHFRGVLDVFHLWFLGPIDQIFVFTALGKLLNIQNAVAVGVVLFE